MKSRCSVSKNNNSNLFQPIQAHQLEDSVEKMFWTFNASLIFGCHLIVMLIIIHLLIGFGTQKAKRLRQTYFYEDDYSRKKEIENYIERNELRLWQLRIPNHRL